MLHVRTEDRLLFTYDKKKKRKAETRIKVSENCMCIQNYYLKERSKNRRGAGHYLQSV